MKIDIRSRSQATTYIVLLTGLVLSSLLLPFRASAELGGDVTSVEADRQQMKATRTVQSTAKYAMHELQTDSGTVREYVTPDGKVFGVAWQGPTIPDLRQLLGNYYPQFDQAAAAHRKLRHRGPLAINEFGLVVVSTGHMRAYSGKAYVSGLLPQGVQAEDIR
jgi:hypothetical protein